MRIEAADGDARGAAAHPHESIVAEPNGLNDARVIEAAGLLEGNMRADVDGCQLLRVEQHAGFGRAGQLGNVFGVSGERAAGERDRFFIERRRDHGVGFAAHAEFHGAADIGDGREAVLCAKLAEGNGVIGGQRTGFNKSAGQRGRVNAGKTARSVERG